MLTILCAVRTNETINATWPEFDLENKISAACGEADELIFGEVRGPLLALSGRDASLKWRPVSTGDLNRSTQHFILEGKD